MRRARRTALLVRIVATNRGPEAAQLHVLPTLWFRNTWSWGDETATPSINEIDPPAGAAWAVEANHEELGRYRLSGRQRGELLFTNNDTNHERLWGGNNATPFVKDAFHRRVIGGEADVVNPARSGTKFALWSKVTLRSGGARRNRTRARVQTGEGSVRATSKSILAEREREADAFYDDFLLEGGSEDRRIMRQAFAGMIWNKQFFHYDVERWLAATSIHRRPSACAAETATGNM